MKRIGIAILAATLAIGAQTKDDAQTLFKTAQNTELIDGNLNAAIKQYGDIVARFAKTDRGVAAMALVRMAECYQKMGNSESRKLFEQVLREYSDQKEAVLEAQARLGRPSSPGGVVSRQIWTGPKVDVYGSVSRDGHYLSFIDWSSGGNLALHDLVKGGDRLLTQDGEGEYSTISRDGKQIAYAWFKHDQWRYELRIANMSGDPKPRVLFDNEEVSELSPYEWTPDSKWIAVGLKRKDHTAQIGLISASTGALTVLKSVDWRGSTRMFFSPDGKYLAYDLAVGDSADQRDVFVLAIDGSREITATRDPNRNMVMGWAPNGALLFASNRSGSMGLYSLAFRAGSPQGSPEFLKADIGTFESSMGITDAGALYFGRTGRSANIQLVPVDWTAGKILGPAVDITKQFVGTNSYPSWSSDGKFLSCISMRDASGLGKFLVTISLDSGRIIREFRPKMSFIATSRSSPDGTTFAVTGTDLKGRNGLFLVEPRTGDAAPIAINELVVGSNRPTANTNPEWGKDGRSLYFLRGTPNSNTSGTTGIVKFDLVTGSATPLPNATDVGPTPIRLSPDGKWLAAATSNRTTQTSSLVLIPIDGGATREILAVKSPNQVTVPGWTPDGLSVIVRKVVASGNGSGNPPFEIWRAPIGGGEPQKLAIDTKSLPPGGPWALSPDGRYIAIPTVGPSIAEVSVLENFLPLPETKK